jgi:hypothetical protein
VQAISVEKIRNKYVAYIAAFVLVAATLILYFNTAAITRQLNAWQLLPQPERLTELYYEKHTELPTTYAPDMQQSYSFTVHNLEYRTTAYKYEVMEQSEDSSQRRVLSSGSFALEHDRSRTTAITISPIDFGPRVKIVTTINKNVSDNDGNESIHYWVTRRGA